MGTPIPAELPENPGKGVESSAQHQPEGPVLLGNPGKGVESDFISHNYILLIEMNPGKGVESLDKLRVKRRGKAGIPERELKA